MAPWHTSSEPLVWVKLRGMQVFWPACVYSSYSAAARHGHDTTSLRSAKPVLDAEDRVVVFLGIDASAKSTATVHGGVVPNLRQCVAAVDDITSFPWEGADEFAKVCRTYHVPEEMIERAGKHSVFRRATRDASQLETAISDEADARRVFLSFLRRPREASTAVASAAVVKRKIPSGDPTVNALAKKRHVENSPAAVAVATTTPSTTPTPVGVDWSEDVVAACWQMMEGQGWSTMKQGDGVVFYTMPGVSFFDFRPNVTVFDSLKSAVSKFLQLYVETTAADLPVAAASPLDDLLWKSMSANGWQTMTSANETWYIMPNTPFDQCVPNVTIFRSKSQAVAKFLASLCVIEPTADENDRPTVQTSVSGEAENSESGEEEDTDSMDECSKDFVMAESEDDHESEEEEESEASSDDDDPEESGHQTR
ncbi:hypothetical protein P43SY_009962 [Pythium insidiosum]|uniref:Uncharacterized protein n=1 Tax=Pythium insidiosum TaxID=114742 RepID=A0AAD5Q608_PYTIN|nr:hypothetical protein P43SY_009962 [Pythium insidiosum]